MYDIRRKECFKSKCIEHASKACNGEPRIKYSVENVGENKFWGEFDFEANRRSDISKYFLFVNWCSIDDLGLAMLVSQVRSLVKAYLRLNKVMTENLG